MHEAMGRALYHARSVLLRASVLIPNLCESNALGKTR